MAKRGRPRSPDVLTPREEEVLALIRGGLTNPQIASALGITVETTKQHVSEILSKLGVSTREEAATWAPEERERQPWHRWAIAALGTATIVGTLLVLGLLAWGVLESEGGSQATACTLGENGDTPRPTHPAFLGGDIEGDFICWHDMEGEDSYTVEFSGTYVVGCDWRRTFPLTDPQPIHETFDLPPDTTSVLLPPPSDPRFSSFSSYDLRIRALDDAGETVGLGGTAYTGEISYEDCSPPAIHASISPPRFSAFPDGLAPFTVALSQALRSRDLAFFQANTAFGRWNCGGGPPPGAEPNCFTSDISDPEGGDGIVLGLWNSEGDVLSIADYEEYVSTTLLRTHEAPFDDFGPALPRVYAVADIPVIEEGESQTYELVITYIDTSARTTEVSVVPGMNERRAALVFLVKEIDGAWKITRIDRALPALLDPFSPLGVEQGLDEMVENWAWWTESVGQPFGLPPAP